MTPSWDRQQPGATGGPRLLDGFRHSMGAVLQSPSPFFFLLLSSRPAVAAAGKPGPCVFLQATHGNRGSAINEGSVSLPDWHVRQMFSLLFQAVRSEKVEDDFLSPPGANHALAKLLRSQSQAANPAWTAVLELLDGLQGCSLPGCLRVCEAGSSCRDGMG